MLSADGNNKHEAPSPAKPQTSRLQAILAQVCGHAPTDGTTELASFGPLLSSSSSPHLFFNENHVHAHQQARAYTRHCFSLILLHVPFFLLFHLHVLSDDTQSLVIHYPSFSELDYSSKVLQLLPVAKRRRRGRRTILTQ